MIRTQRTVHRWSWPALGVALLVVTWLGLAARRPEPIADQLPPPRADQREAGAARLADGGEVIDHAPGVGR